ncbi:spermidine/putrescine ABC transporter substrate-binding protein [Halomonas sp. 18H]|uniref:ABC transporter substrate-binding protein n=1 Tax=Halomonas almeriensis TaxID=308163 RepID=UPI00222FEE0C|nr:MULTISPECIES: spermidine/putrescine ABC transporter substrate-binding protein [Halomonas]MCW4151594.1 spermidine/putrescine ABC transporter substrate-binding protein [Halomonas sp. 18H]MDN3552731.1 spermidine/putrescine ABC transporter substrate-binding protein [Halomonas almeriensis]
MRLLLAGVVGACVLGAATASTADEAKKLYVFNWTEYMSPEVVEDFEAQYDVEVVENYFTSNAEMFSKLSAGADAQYDVVVPTDYFVPRLINAGLIQAFDPELIEGRDNLMEAFRQPSYDPQEQYSVPYLWGATGIVYNTRTFPDPAESWGMLFDPELNPDQPFALLGGDPQVALGMACAYQGAGFDCVGQQPWVEAARLASETLDRPNFTGFVDSTAAVEQVARGVSQLAVTYSGDVDYRKAASPETYEHLEFFVPEEGSQLGVDTLVIPARAPHPKLAHQFISFLMQPENAARSASFAYYRSPNAAALEDMPEELAKSSRLEDDRRDQLVTTPLIEGEQLQMLQQIWTEVRSR